MALESIEGAGKYINDLDENNPLSSDPPGTDGDNHLRGIKNTIKNTFPNVNGEVSATQTQLDYVVVGTLGTSEASKAVTADASGDVILSGNVTVSYGANDVDIVSHDGTNGLKLGGVLVTPSAAELNHSDGVTSNIQTQLDALTNSLSPTVKSGNETVNNSTTLQADDHLTFTLETSSTYAFELYVLYSSDASADIKFSFTGPAGSAGYFSTHGGTAAYVIGTDINTQATSGAASIMAKSFIGAIATGLTGGSLTFEWAQNAAVAVDTTVYAGSWLKVRKA